MRRIRRITQHALLTALLVIMGNAGSLSAQADAINAVPSLTISQLIDGQTWALANGKWYWATVATPGASKPAKLKE